MQEVTPCSRCKKELPTEFFTRNDKVNKTCNECSEKLYGPSKEKGQRCVRCKKLYYNQDPLRHPFYYEDKFHSACVPCWRKKNPKNEPWWERGVTEFILDAFTNRCPNGDPTDRNSNAKPRGVFIPPERRNGQDVISYPMLVQDHDRGLATDDFVELSALETLWW